MLVAACKPRAPECFKLPSASRTYHAKIAGDVDELQVSEAFVITNPPKGGEQLLQAVVKLCDGGLRPPNAGASDLRWSVLRETRDTPRTLVIGHGKHDSLDVFRDALILELGARWRACEAKGDYSYYPDGYEDTDLTKYPPGQRFDPPPLCAKPKP